MNLNDDFVFLMSVPNDIIAQNVIGILEMEGIKSVSRMSSRGEIKSAFKEDGSMGVGIYVPFNSYEDAREIIETEMVRGDL